MHATKISCTYSVKRTTLTRKRYVVNFTNSGKIGNTLTRNMTLIYNEQVIILFFKRNFHLMFMLARNWQQTRLRGKLWYFTSITQVNIVVIIVGWCHLVDWKHFSENPRELSVPILQGYHVWSESNVIAFRARKLYTIIKGIIYLKKGWSILEIWHQFLPKGFMTCLRSESLQHSSHVP